MGVKMYQYQVVLSKCANLNWSRGVTVRTLDSESSDRGSNPRGTLAIVVMCMEVKVEEEEEEKTFFFIAKKHFFFIARKKRK